MDLVETQRRPSGLEYRVEGDGLLVDVLIGLDDDGDDWHCAITLRGIGPTARARDPLTAFRAAGSLVRELQARTGGVALIDEIEELLDHEEAFLTEVPEVLPIAKAHALGIHVDYPAPLDRDDIERALRAADFVRSTLGVSSHHWHIVRSDWVDAGRSISVVIKLGRSGPPVAT